MGWTSGVLYPFVSVPICDPCNTIWLGPRLSSTCTADTLTVFRSCHECTVCLNVIYMMSGDVHGKTGGVVDEVDSGSKFSCNLSLLSLSEIPSFSSVTAIMTRHSIRVDVMMARSSM